MQRRKRWNDDTLLGRRDTSKSAGHSGISISLQATEMGRQAAAPPLKDGRTSLEAACHAPRH
jgi:hypothetical protein